MLLAGQIDPAGMIALLEAVRQEEARLSTARSDVSIHQQTEVDIAPRKSLIAASAAGSRTLLADYPWSDNKNLCPAPVKTTKELKIHWFEFTRVGCYSRR